MAEYLLGGKVPDTFKMEKSRIVGEKRPLVLTHCSTSVTAIYVFRFQDRFQDTEMGEMHQDRYLASTVDSLVLLISKLHNYLTCNKLVLIFIYFSIKR